MASQLGCSAARKGPGPPGGKEGEREAATCPRRERLKVIQGKRDCSITIRVKEEWEGKGSSVQNGHGSQAGRRMSCSSVHYKTKH